MKSWEIKTKIPKPKRAQRKAESWWGEGRQQIGPGVKANPVPKGLGREKPAEMVSQPQGNETSSSCSAGTLRRERTSFLRLKRAVLVLPLLRMHWVCGGW